MRQSVVDFVVTTLREKPFYVTGKDVVEAGSLNVNGTIRPYIAHLNPKTYIATDMRLGIGVDVVCKAEDLPPRIADLVICLDMLEHAEDWRAAVLGLALALRTGGWLIIVAPSPGFPEHDHPSDYQRFSVATMRNILKACGMDIISCEPTNDTNPEEVGVCAIGKKVRRPNVEALVAIEAEPIT